MNLWTIIPVKSLDHTKSRLANILSLAERGRLTETLLRRTLQQLESVPLLEETAVISLDPTVADIARAYGRRCVAEPVGSGLNGAVATGYALATANGASHLLVLPSDLPFLNRIELDMLLAAAAAVSPPTLLICGDQRQQGTNGMIVPTGLGFQFRYGRHSFQHHQQEATRLGLPCKTLQLPGFQFDLDSEQDYDIYTKQRHFALPQS